MPTSASDYESGPGEDVAAAPSGMTWIPGGTFRMGSDNHYPEEAPVHRVNVDGFWIDRTPVTNRQFKRIRQGDGPRHYRRDPAGPEGLSRRAAAYALRRVAGILAAHARVDLARLEQWWRFMKGADWRHPYGPRSNINGLDDHPVVHVAYVDALAYADGRARNCRPKPNGSSPRAAASTAPSSPGATSSRPAASTWPTPGTANFRAQNLKLDGYERTSPVKALSAERLRPVRHDRQCLGVDR